MIHTTSDYKYRLLGDIGIQSYIEVYTIEALQNVTSGMSCSSGICLPPLHLQNEGVLPYGLHNAGYDSRFVYSLRVIHALIDLPYPFCGLL